MKQLPIWYEFRGGPLGGRFLEMPYPPPPTWQVPVISSRRTTAYLGETTSLVVSPPDVCTYRLVRDVYLADGL